jgi:hypothetical protein
MACKYIYKEKEYSKEELIGILKNDGTLNNLSVQTFRSIVTKSPTLDITEKSIKLMQQRKIDAINLKKSVMNSDLSKKEKIKKVVEYEDIINDANESIKNLQTITPTKKLNFILSMAENDSKIVDAAFESNDLNLDQHKFVQEIVSTWNNINSLLEIGDLREIKDAELKDRLEKIKQKYTGYSEISRSEAKRLIANSIKGPKVSAENLDKIIDTHFTTEYFRELSTAGIPITNKLAYIINEINLIINKEHNKNYSEIDRYNDLIKDNPTFKKIGWDLFVKNQKNSLGEETLGIVTRYSQKFWDAYRNVNQTLKKDLEKAGDDKDKIKEVYNNFNNWKNKNTIVFNAIYFLEPSKFSDANREGEISRIKAMGYAESEIDNMIAESQRLYDRFLFNKDVYEYRIELNAIEDPSLIPTGKTLEEYVKEKVDEYDEINNPLKYYDQKFFGTQKFTAYGASKYLYLIPVKTIDGTDTKYYDENFIKISQDPKLLEYYSWFTGFMREKMSWLPEEETNSLGSNFLPVIAERVVKEYGFTELKESVAGLGDWFLKALTAYNYDNKVDVNPVTKKERRTIKTKFLDNNVSIKDRSKNLTIVAKMFSDMATIYRHKSMVRSEIDTINDILQETKGSYKFNKKLGELEEQAKDATRIKSLADSTVSALFYGIIPEDTLPRTEEQFYDWKELASFGFWKSEKGKKAKELEDNIKKLNEELDKDTLTSAEREKIQNDIYTLKGEYLKLGGRSLSTTSTIDSLIKGTRLTALAIKPFSAAKNLLVGKLNNRFHAAGGLDFNERNLIMANKTIIDSFLNYVSLNNYQTTNVKKISGLLIDAGIAEGGDNYVLNSLIDKKTTLDAFRKLIPSAYTLLSSGDYHFKSEMLVACTFHDKIKGTSKGEVSFWDVLTENREYNEAEYGPWDKDANDGLTFNEYYNKKMLKYKQLANKLHGLSGKNTYIKGKDTAIGRLLILFKAWLPETVGVRWDPKHKDDMLGRYEEGYYRTFLKQVVDKKFAVLGMMVNAMLKRKITGITDEVELANFKKAVKELQVIITLKIAYMLLKSMAPDDDRYKKIYNLLVLRQLKDLNTDLTYYSSFSSFSRLQENVVPIMRTIENWQEAGKAIEYYSLEIEKENGELEYDGERTALKITKVLPVLSNVNTVIYYEKQID